MNINLKLNGKSLIGLVLLSTSLVFADYVSLINAKSSGGIIVNENNFIDTTPIGSVVMWGSSTPPDGWLEMNGQSTSSYPELAAIYGSTLPDLRGEFVRGWDNGRGVDASRSLKGYQAGTKIAGEAGITSSMNTHTIHNINNVFGDPVYETNFETHIQYDTETSNQSLSNSASWWRTVRPRNVSLMYIVKAEQPNY